MKIVKPKVFLISEPRLNMGEFYRYLGHIGATEFETDAYSDAEALPEIMGRICYRSWKPGLNPNVTKVREGNSEYLKNIIESGHGSVLEHSSLSFIFADVSRVLCYGEDTEILTSSGWISLPLLKSGDVVLTKNPNTGLDRWSVNKKTHKFRYSGIINWFESSQWSSPKMTPDHLVWIRKYDLRANKNKTLNEVKKLGMVKVPLSEVLDRRFVVDHEIQLEKSSFPDNIKIGDYSYNPLLFFKWLGILCSDGTISKCRNRLSIVQTKKHNVPEIISVMDGLFGNRWKNYETSFAISDPALKKWVISLVGRLKKDRNLSRLLNFDRRLISEFLSGFVLGDGNYNNGHLVVYCGYEQLAAGIQSLFAAVGRSSNIRVDDRVSTSRTLNGKPIVKNSNNYIVSVHLTGESLVKKEHIKSEWYDGFVFCPETDDGLVYVRRKGMSFWSGNTHELVRHRTGVAISQESLRYVRLDQLSAFIPMVILENEAGSTLFFNSFEEAEKLQKEFADLFDIEGKSFHRKKELTSAFRRVAPMGLATTIGWTANIRTIRHVLEVRTHPSAEEEIRFTFSEVGDIMLKRYPALFQDYETELVNGYKWFKTVNKKV